MTKEMVGHDSEEDEEEEFKNSKLWVSREVLGGAGFGESSDVYSFGIVLWEIVEGDGTLPFAGLSPEEVSDILHQLELIQ